MSIRRLPVLGCIALFGCLAMLAGSSGAWANEVQLAGVRLGQHAMHVIQVYGQPDGVIKGAGGPAATPPSQARVGAAVASMRAGLAAGMAEQEARDIAGVSADARGPGLGPTPAEARDKAALEEARRQLPAVREAEAAQATGAASGGLVGDPPSAKTFSRSNVPDWAAPVWVPMQRSESLWVYKVKAVVLGFVIDRDGYVVAIAVAGNKCSFARTAGWAPNRSVKLGDDYKEVISRYGYPEKTTSYDPGVWVASHGSAGPTLGGGIANASRNLILHYGVTGNIEFLLLDMKVVRIHIWEPEMREPGPGLPTTSAAATGAGGAMPGMGGMGPGGPMGGGPGGGMGPAGP